VNEAERTRLAATLMDGFAAATGLAGSSQPVRYLWTDAFAVGNFLGLHKATGKAAHLEFALRLVEQVHHVLGRHRADDARQGWISGLDKEEGSRHPTRGGLRIGKPLPERAPGEPFDARAEWDRDGQYFHYLTQWMHALHRVAAETGQGAFAAWATELARAAHAAFARGRSPAGIEGLAWKMSIDLRRALVPSMGQHDALDALAVYLELQCGGVNLDREISEVRPLAEAGRLETGDALGIGALLTNAYRLVTLPVRYASQEAGLVARVLAAAEVSLSALAHEQPLSAPAHARLAFRELGLAIGLRAMQDLHASGRCAGSLAAPLGRVLDYLWLADGIDACWSDPAHRRSGTWAEHQHINDVMLATSLRPEGYLGC
jgi:hypothetical protein